MRTCCNWKPWLAIRKRVLLNTTETTVGQKDQGTLQGFRHSSFQTAGALGPCICLLSCFSCIQLCDTVDGSPPGSSVHGILQARTLAWAAMPFSRRSPDPGIESTSHKPLALQADSSQLSHWGSPALGLGCPKPQAVLPHSLESGPQSLSHSPAYGDWPHY